MLNYNQQLAFWLTNEFGVLWSYQTKMSSKRFNLRCKPRFLQLRPIIGNKYHVLVFLYAQALLFSGGNSNISKNTGYGNIH